MMHRQERRNSCAETVETLCGSMSRSQSTRRGVVSSRSMARSSNGSRNLNKINNHNSTASTWSASSSLLSVLAWSMTLLLVSSCFGIADAGALMSHPFSKRSFMDIQCKGVYDKSLFARLDRICEDCYNLFREPLLHKLCRQNCFGSEYFTSCIQALLLEDEKEKFQEIAEYLGRKK